MYSEDKKRVASWTKLIALRKGKKKISLCFLLYRKIQVRELKHL